MDPITRAIIFLLLYFNFERVRRRAPRRNISGYQDVCAIDDVAQIA